MSGSTGKDPAVRGFMNGIGWLIAALALGGGVLFYISRFQTDPVPSVGTEGSGTVEEGNPSGAGGVRHQRRALEVSRKTRSRESGFRDDNWRPGRGDGPQTSSGQGLEDSPEGDRKLLQALDLIDQERYEDAVAALEEILREDPDGKTTAGADALGELGFLYLRVFEDPEKAQTYLQRAVQADPESAEATFDLVGTYLLRNDVEGGVSFLKGVLETHPKSSNVTFAMGDMLAARGRLDEALPYFERAVAMPNSRDYMWSGMGAAYLESGRTQDAVRAFREATSRSEVEVNERRDRGESTIVAENQLARSLGDLAHAMMEAGDLNGAEETLNRLARQRPDDLALGELRRQLTDKKRM